MTAQNHSQLALTLIVRNSVTVLPRCLQILSRRGFTLQKLETEALDDVRTKLSIVVEGYDHWHTAIPHLLSRIVEVDEVSTEPDNE